MKIRSASGGSLRPMRAPSRPPMVEATAISSTTSQFTWAKMMYTMAAEPVTVPTSTFAPVAPASAELALQQPVVLGPVGQGRREADREQRRDGDQRSRADDRVDG